MTERFEFDKTLKKNVKTFMKLVRNESSSCQTYLSSTKSTDAGHSQDENRNHGAGPSGKSNPQGQKMVNLPVCVYPPHYKRGMRHLSTTAEHALKKKKRPCSTSAMQKRPRNTRKERSGRVIQMTTAKTVLLSPPQMATKCATSSSLTSAPTQTWLKLPSSIDSDKQGVLFRQNSLCGQPCSLSPSAKGETGKEFTSCALNPLHSMSNFMYAMAVR